MNLNEDMHQERVLNYCGSLEAENAALKSKLASAKDSEEALVKVCEEALVDLKVRICFVGHPNEEFLENGKPDWSHAVKQLEAALKVVKAAKARLEEG